MRSCLCFQLFGEDVSEEFREAEIFSLTKELVPEGPFLLGRVLRCIMEDVWHAPLQVIL